MNKSFIRRYIERLSINDIKNFALKQGIVLNNYECNNIYKYVKDNYEYYLDINMQLDEIIDIAIGDAKKLLSDNNYNVVYDIYLKYKNKI